MHQNVLSSLTRLWSKKMRTLLNNKTDFLFPEKEAAVPMLMKISIMKVLLMFNEILQF